MGRTSALRHKDVDRRTRLPNFKRLSIFSGIHLEIHDTQALTPEVLPLATACARLS